MREAFEREFVGVFDVALRAPAHVLGLGLRAQRLIARLRCDRTSRFFERSDQLIHSFCRVVDGHHPRASVDVCSGDLSADMRAKLQADAISDNGD